MAFDQKMADEFAKAYILPRAMDPPPSIFDEIIRVVKEKDGTEMIYVKPFELPIFYGNIEGKKP